MNTLVNNKEGSLHSHNTWYLHIHKGALGHDEHLYEDLQRGDPELVLSYNCIPNGHLTSFQDLSQHGCSVRSYVCHLNLSKSINGNEYILVIVNGSVRVPVTIRKTKFSDIQILTLFLTYFVLNYGLPSKLVVNFHSIFQSKLLRSFLSLNRIKLNMVLVSVPHDWIVDFNNACVPFSIIAGNDDFGVCIYPNTFGMEAKRIKWHLGFANLKIFLRFK